MNEKLLESIKKHEGLKLKPYLCPAGKTTIGFGRNLEDSGIREDEAEQMLLNDTLSIAFTLSGFRFFHKNLNLARKNVLIEMAYQLGVNGLLKFKKFLKFVEDEEYEKASLEMLDSTWAEQTHKRAKELSKIMKKGDY